jgi:hypothetical protein
MKTFYKIFLFSMFLIIPFYCFAETEDDGYFIDDNSKEYFETSVGENNDENISSKEKSLESRTEKKQYSYDVEISPYVSVRYTSTSTIKEDY